MKRSAAAIGSFAVAFSMFSSAALAQSSADFTDLKDLDAATKAKFDAMISAGVFDGVSDTYFGLKDNMNRAQFAKVAALIFGLKVDNTLRMSIFTDVKADDPANGYALPYVEAIVKAGLTDGVAPGRYDPAGQVTKEQLAAFLVRGLGLEAAARASAGVNDGTVSDWARGYAAVALEKRLFAAASSFGGTTPAARDLLVLSAYEAKQQYRPVFNGQYAIASLKATDSNELTVVLNGAVPDTSQAKLEIRRNGSLLTSGYTTTWSADKTTAVLKFDSKFRDATYNVTLSGLSNIDNAARSAEIKTTVEKIDKIEFLTAGDTLPETQNKIRIDFKATNQYGKKSSLSASSFEIRTSRDVQSVAISGEQAFYLTLPSDVERDDRVNVTIRHDDSAVLAAKTFIIGDEPMVTKVEVGDLLSSSGSKIDMIPEHGQAYLDIKAYDQYGARVLDMDTLNDDVYVSINDNDLETGVVGNDDPFVPSVIGDDAADLMLRSVSDEQKEVTVTIFARGGQTVTKTIKLSSGNIPAMIEFGAYNYTLSQGDVPSGDDETDAKFYLPLIIRDAAGNPLSGQEIYDRRDKLDIDSSSGVELANPPISGSGAYKGMIAIKSVGTKSSATISVELEDNSAIRTDMRLTINDKRKADDIGFSITPKRYMIAGGENEFAVNVKDQFGDALKYDAARNYLIRYTLRATGGDAASLNAVQVASVERNNHSASQPRKYSFSQMTAVGQEAILNLPLASNADDQVTAYNKSFKFYAGDAAREASYTLKATLLQADTKGSIDIGGKKYMEVDSVTSQVEVLNPNNPNNTFTYEVYLDESAGNSLIAADDYMRIGTGAAGAKNLVDNYKGFAKQVKVRVRKSGEEVSAPSAVVSATSSNSQVADVNNMYVAGGKAGTAMISVIYTDAKKDMKTASLNVTAKNEGPVVKAISLKRSSKAIAAGQLKNGVYLWDARLAEKISVTDQFGGVFVAEGAPGSMNEEGKPSDNELVRVGNAGYNNNLFLNLTYYLTDVTGSNKGNLIIDRDGKITLNGGAAAGDVSSFTVNVLAPSGVQASFAVSVN
jgi:hypothetical protein